MKKIVLVLLIFSCFFIFPKEKNKKENGDKINYVEIAAILIKDGFYERAEDALNKADTTAKNFDFNRYYTLKGLIYLKKSLYVEAKSAFEKALLNGNKDEIIFLYLSQSCLNLKDYNCVIDSFNKSGKLKKEYPALYLMKATAYWSLDKKESAFSVIKEGIAERPDFDDFYRAEIFYLIELGLFQEAAHKAEVFISKKKAKEYDYLAIGNAFRKSKEYLKAATYLEAARILFPENLEITAELGRVFVESNQLFSAAQLFEFVAEKDARFLIESAELYRKSKKFNRALSINSRISNQKDKIKQKLMIYLDMENYEVITGMIEDLERFGLMKDEEIIYAVAYAYFVNGQFDKSESLLKRLNRPDLFRKAAELRKEIERCRSEFCF